MGVDAVPTLTQVLADVLEIRGVLAVAVASVDGEILAGGASDAALLGRMTGAVTGALAAGEAFSGLVAKSLTGARADDEWSDPDDEGVGHVPVGGEAPTPVAGGGKPPTGSKQLMVIYEDSGPIVFTPLPGGERVAVMALSSTHDLGRARFQLRGLTDALATAEVPLG